MILGRNKSKPSWYVDINRKRRSTKTADHREAMAIYRDLVRKQDFSESQSKSESVESFVSDYLKWSKGLHADNTLRFAREAMAKLQRHIGVLNLKDIDQKAIDRLVGGLLGEGLSRPSVNAHLRKATCPKKRIE